MYLVNKDYYYFKTVYVLIGTGGTGNSGSHSRTSLGQSHSILNQVDSCGILTTEDGDRFKQWDALRWRLFRFRKKNCRECPPMNSKFKLTFKCQVLVTPWSAREWDWMALYGLKCR